MRSIDNILSSLPNFPSQTIANVSNPSSSLFHKVLKLEIIFTFLKGYKNEPTQSANQPTHQSTNQPNSQPTKYTTKEDVTETICGSQSLKYLSSGPLQEKFADSFSRANP